ncbi:MAG: hypothetical protein ABFE08_03045 [Armatimonadia bacterium]
MSKSSLSALSEPHLQFRYLQQTEHPRDGLALFGPYDADSPARPSGITYAVIGTPDGQEAYSRWAAMVSRPVVADAAKYNQRLWQPWPGFEAAFQAQWPGAAGWTYTVDSASLDAACHQADPHKRANDTVQLYLGGLEVARRRDESFGVAVCVVPDDVWLYCRPESGVADAVGTAVSRRDLSQRRAGALNLFEDYDAVWYKRSRDFRRQLKLRAMDYGMPIQIVRQSTLALTDEDTSRGLTPMCDRMWNLSTTLYYKCGGKPWRLAAPRPGVCYLGMSYRRTGRAADDKTACCAALMFVDNGDGIVFIGETGPWWSAETRQFHVSGSAAASLLAGTLKTHQEMHGSPIDEVFIHARSGIDDEEWNGFLSACPPGVKVVAVRVQGEHGGLKLYRQGTHPVVRGTCWRTSDRSCLLWASGFKPRLGTYDGFEVPNPLRIDIQHGEADLDTVASDVLALTKLDYNACKLGAGEPVTIRFSDAVGEILVTNDANAKGRPNFKYYI